MDRLLPRAPRSARRGALGRSAALGALVLAAGLGCSAPPPPVPLRVGVLGVQSELPYLVMRQEGLDRRHGLLLRETRHASGPEMLRLLAAGSLDVAVSIGTVPALSAATSGLVPAGAVIAAAESFADPAHPAMAVLAGSSVRDWADLAGGAIAVNGPGTLGAVAIHVRLAAEGVSGHRLIDISFPNMGLAVAGGNAAAAVMTEPWLTQSLLRGDGRLLGWVIGGAPFERMQLTVLAFSGDLYRGRPDAARAYLRAHVASLAWIRDNPARIRPLLTRRLGLSPAVGAAMHLLEWSPDGRSDVGSLERIEAALRRSGARGAPAPVARLLDESLLRQVLAERR